MQTDESGAVCQRATLCIDNDLSDEWLKKVAHFLTIELQIIICHKNGIIYLINIGISY